MTKPEAGKIRIAMGVVQIPSGKLVPSHYREVEAEVYGPLAVHEAFGLWREKPTWNVTHVATGCAVVEGQSRARARKLAKKLQGFAWEKVTVKRGIKGWKDAEAVLAIVAESSR